MDEKIKEYLVNLNNEELANLYYDLKENPMQVCRRLGIPYNTEEVKEIEKYIINILRSRGWYFCPVHGTPLLPRVVAVVLTLFCPIGGAYYEIKGNKVVPLSAPKIRSIRKLVKELKSSEERQWAELLAKAREIPPEFERPIREYLFFASMFNPNINPDVPSSELFNEIIKAINSNTTPQYVREGLRRILKLISKKS